MDKIVFDIETKNLISDVGGEKHIEDLDVSLIGAYSYNKNKFLSFTEHELDDASELFKNAGIIIGFSSNRFDVPVLKKYFSFDISAIFSLDLLEEIELSYGRRISLDLLAKANLGMGKTHHGLEAINLYRDGKIDELRDYCLNDVKITKDLYELAEKQGFLLIPHKITNELIRVPLDWKEKLLDIHLAQSLW